MIPGPCVGLGLVDTKRTCIPETGRTPNLRDAGAGFLYTGFSYGIAATALSFSTNFWATALVGYRALYVAFLFLLHSTVKLIESLAFGQGIQEVREEARHRGLARVSDGACPLAPPRVWRVLLCHLGEFRFQFAGYASLRACRLICRVSAVCLLYVCAQAIVVVWQIGVYVYADADGGMNSFWEVYGFMVEAALVPVIVRHASSSPAHSSSAVADSMRP